MPEVMGTIGQYDTSIINKQTQCEDNKLFALTFNYCQYTYMYIQIFTHHIDIISKIDCLIVLKLLVTQKYWGNIVCKAHLTC